MVQILAYVYNLITYEKKKEDTINAYAADLILLCRCKKIAAKICTASIEAIHAQSIAAACKLATSIYSVFVYKAETLTPCIYSISMYMYFSVTIWHCTQ